MLMIFFYPGKKYLRTITNTILSLSFLLLMGQAVHGAPYPDFAGNYIECESGWCELENWQLNVLSKYEKFDNSKKGRMLMCYAGFFTIPKTTVNIANSKPRILVYTGRDQTDPRTLALVELAPLPYSNDKIDTIDGKEYSNITYSKSFVTKQLWTYKEEVPLKFMPVEGKTGIYVFKPNRNLSNGVYVLDTGTITAKGLENLNTKPEAFIMGGSIKLSHPQTALPFIIHQADNISVDKDSYSALDMSTIVKMQKQLKNIGYYSGPIDGHIGPRTTSAIKSFQRSKNLPEDGRPSEILMTHLGLSDEQKMSSTSSRKNTAQQVTEPVSSYIQKSTSSDDRLFDAIFGR